MGGGGAELPTPKGGGVVLAVQSAGMACRQRGKAKREAGSVPAWPRPLGSQCRGLAAPSTILQALGEGLFVP